MQIVKDIPGDETGHMFTKDVGSLIQINQYLSTTKFSYQFYCL